MSKNVQTQFTITFTNMMSEEQFSSFKKRIKDGAVSMKDLNLNSKTKLFITEIGIERTVLMDKAEIKLIVE